MTYEINWKHFSNGPYKSFKMDELAHAIRYNYFRGASNVTYCSRSKQPFSHISESLSNAPKCPICENHILLELLGRLGK